MENSIHKGTELNNVKETWDQNERQRGKESPAGADGNTSDEAQPVNELEQLIKKEATEYDNVNKEDRVLGGDRASVNDEASGDASDE